MDVIADADMLMRQAPMTVEVYFLDVVRTINDKFGVGYANQHPELVAALVAACAQDFHTANVRIAAQDIRDALIELHNAVIDVSEAVSAILKPS